MSDQNLYPVEPPGVRRRRRRRPRPAHLPPFDPTDLPAPTFSPKPLPTAPALATFGSAVGANNALLFHQLRARPATDPRPPPPSTDTLDES